MESNGLSRTGGKSDSEWNKNQMRKVVNQWRNQPSRPEATYLSLSEFFKGKPKASADDVFAHMQSLTLPVICAFHGGPPGEGCWASINSGVNTGVQSCLLVMGGIEGLVAHIQKNVRYSGAISGYVLPRHNNQRYIGDNPLRVFCRNKALPNTDSTKAKNTGHTRPIREEKVVQLLLAYYPPSERGKPIAAESLEKKIEAINACLMRHCDKNVRQCAQEGCQSGENCFVWRPVHTIAAK